MFDSTSDRSGSGLPGHGGGQPDGSAGRSANERASARASARRADPGAEVIGAGFTHEDQQEDATGFAAGGDRDRLPAGPALNACVEEAFEAGIERLSDDELVGVLCAARRLASRQAAIELAAVAELDARRCDGQERVASMSSEHVSAELAAALTLTSRAADSLLCLGRDLARLPQVSGALADGRLDRPRAEVFASELGHVGDLLALAIAAALSRPAEGMTTGQLRAAIRSLVLAVDPAAASRRSERARADARVEAWQETSGNGALAGRELPAAEMIAADKRIDAIARSLKDAGAAGGMDQLRVAVFCALLTGRDPETLLPARVREDALASGPSRGRRASDAPCPAGDRDPAGWAPAGWAPAGWAPGMSGSVNLTMPLQAWVGLSDAPGEVLGVGPLDADTCRVLAERIAQRPGNRWCLTLTDSGGQAMAHACSREGPGTPGSGGARPGEPARSARSDGETRPQGTEEAGARLAAWLASLHPAWLESGNCAHRRESKGYTPAPALRHLVKIRQRTCGFPGCRRPASACDDDHTVPFDQGGKTCECNLAPLCRRHHRVKQGTGWRLEQREPGVLAWTTPAGRRYRTAPGSYPG